MRGVVFLLLAGCCCGGCWAGSAVAMARGGGVELGEPERYCARLVKLDRFRCDDFEFPANSAEGMGGTGTLMHDMGEMILGCKMALLLFMAATVAGGGGGGGSGGGGGGMGEADVKTRLGGALGC